MTKSFAAACSNDLLDFQMHLTCPKGIKRARVTLVRFLHADLI